MNKEDLLCLIGKYLNGYKIVKVEDDPFIKGQINLFTDEWKCETFNDRYLVKFYIRNEGNTSKIYQELVDKENYELKQALSKIKEYLVNELKSDRSKDNQWLMGCYDEDKRILEIIDKVLRRGDK